MTPEVQQHFAKLKHHFEMLVENFSPTWRDRGMHGLVSLMAIENAFDHMEETIAVLRTPAVSTPERE